MENQPIIENQPGLELPETKKNHTLLAVIISVIVTAAIVGGGVYYWQNMGLKTAEENLANIKQNLQQQIDDLTAQLESPECSATEPCLGDFVCDRGKCGAPIADQIENWSLYEENTSVQVGAGKCGNQEFENFLVQANAGSRKTFDLYGLTLVITPNYNNWSNQKFLDFNNDNTAICDVGGYYPLQAYSDKLLWRGVCSGGAGPEPGELGYAEKVAALNRCEDTVTDINIYFSTLAANKNLTYRLFQDDTYRFRVTATSKTCEDYYDVKVIESLTTDAKKSYGIFVPGSKNWPQEYPAFSYAIYSQADYNKFSPTELPGKPEITLRLDNGDLLTWWQPQDSPPDMPQDCRINFEKF